MPLLHQDIKVSGIWAWFHLEITAERHDVFSVATALWCLYIDAANGRLKVFFWGLFFLRDRFYRWDMHCHGRLRSLNTLDFECWKLPFRSLFERWKLSNWSLRRNWRKRHHFWCVQSFTISKRNIFRWLDYQGEALLLWEGLWGDMLTIGSLSWEACCLC